MSLFSEAELDSLAATASSAAGYLDACDAGAGDVRLDPLYYQSCGNLLSKIFMLVDAQQMFPILLEQSAAAREVAESVQIARRIEVSRLGFYPELCLTIPRAAA